KRSCENKAELVIADEHEGGVRALLNLGHTFGHAIEAGMGYGNWLHGEAVAAGTMLAAALSQRLGWINETELSRIRSLFERARLPIGAPDLGVDAYLEHMAIDKKVENGRMRFVLLKTIGTAVITADITEQALRETLQATARHA
ncbi:MAG: 3-dehydroquinate synthase, partial [Hydrogenophilales bacterium CG_4_10_14_3_um_filter_58_23]